MLLENMRYPDVEAYLRRKDLVLVPVGSVEQHSPWGLIGTDFIAAEHVARLAAETQDILVAPTLCYGVSPHHLDFAGTVTLSPETFIMVVCDVVRSLAAHGFGRIIFVNGHGGNDAPIQVALTRLKAEGISGILQLLSWYRLPGVVEICSELFQEEEGKHATPGEVAVTIHNRPHAFRSQGPEPVAVEKPDHHWPLTAREFRATFPDGRMLSAPWRATAEHGRRIVEVAVQALRAELTSVDYRP